MANRGLKILVVVAGIVTCAGFFVGFSHYRKQTKKPVIAKSPPKEQDVSGRVVDSVQEEPILSNPFDVLLTNQEEDWTILKEEYLFPDQALKHIPRGSEDDLIVHCEENRILEQFRVTVYIENFVITLRGSTHGDPLDIVARIIAQLIASLEKVVELDEKIEEELIHYITAGYNI